MGLLKNKIALVTGGGRGIGKAIVHQYFEEGATVIIAEFDEKSGKETAELVGGYFVKTDIRDEESVTSLFEYVKTKFTRLDILVNNAGVLQDSTLKNLEPDQFDEVIDVNLTRYLFMWKGSFRYNDEQRGE
jgi:Dehydrogenases with different specificities (related to short-chain alcohol dehydrogenases)